MQTYPQVGEEEVEESSSSEVLDFPYLWAADNPEEWRRCFIFEHMASPDIEGKILVENMSLIEMYLRYGALKGVRSL